THSRRIDPISRSAKLFCQGDAGAMGFPNAHGVQSTGDDAAIDAIPIAEEVTRRLIPRKCLGELACNPFCCRICCDVDPDKVSAVLSNEYEGIDQIEANGRN